MYDKIALQASVIGMSKNVSCLMKLWYI